MRKIVAGVIIFDDQMRCTKCGKLGAFDCTTDALCGDCMPKIPAEKMEPGNFVASIVWDGKGAS